MGDVCKLMTKALHRLIECRNGWDAQVVLNSDALIELKFLAGAFADFELQTNMEAAYATLSDGLF